ncbi:MAG: hydroxymethylbilane synthase [Hyphomicrobiaceae bacterium]|nr:hydroxymethylbilane synthase [Hyphomicrobiaceae bacterium]
MQARTFRIGTRGSPLALAQAHETRDRLVAAHGFPDGAIEIVIIRTSGDRIQDRPLAEVGGKGLFTKEIEEGLLAGTIDLAVHSMKDMPTELPAGLAMAAILPRADVRDAFVSLSAGSLSALPAGARIGTSSLRRAAQVRRARPDLEVVPFRGNVETRLRKLADGVADATLLACAGLHRLGLADRITSPIETDVMLPAVAQGAIGVEIRSADAELAALLAPLDHAQSALEVAAERTLLGRLEGSCRTPIAALARVSGDRIDLRGEILSPDGTTAVATRRTGAVSEAVSLALDAADELKSRGGAAILAR